MRVLLVEGHPVLRETIGNLLRAEPDVHQVDAAKTGVEALPLARAARPDVVLIQADLPVMSGIDATRLLRAEFPDLCIVGMVLFEDAEKAEALRTAGADTVVCKSEPQELVAGMRECHKAHQDQRELAGE